MYDIIRWTLLGLLFASLLGVWLWSRRQSLSGCLSRREGGTGAPLRIVQRRWVDYRTGICIVDVEGRSFLMAYTVGGSVTLEPLPSSANPSPVPPPQK